MKKKFTKVIVSTTLILSPAILTAETHKVLQIFKNDKIIKEYSLEDIDYIEINEIDQKEEVSFDEIKRNLESEIEYIYACITSAYQEGKSIVPGYDGALSTFQRAVFNLEEIPTDEVFWVNEKDDIYPLNFGEINSSKNVVEAAYYGLFKIVSLCNDFIKTEFPVQRIESATYRNEAKALHEEYLRQAKILRSGMYFYLINEFGNVPFADESVLRSDVGQLSSDFSEGRKLVTTKVVKTLEEIVDWYLCNEPDNNPTYGHVGLDVAEALLVKFYLNYEVFTGTPAWEKCLEHAEAIISRIGKGEYMNTGLYAYYDQCFSYNNRNNSGKEIIWRIATQNQDGENIDSYANGNFMINGFVGDSNERDLFQCHSSDYNTISGWKCMVAGQLLTDNLLLDEDHDMRLKWWRTQKDGFSKENKEISSNLWGQNGFLPIKFTNWWIDENGGINKEKSVEPISTPYVDYPMIRLAEIYLSASEAILKGGGNAADAKKYLNYIRYRAGIPIFANAGIPLMEILHERQRELYTECTRRTDLIRFNVWTNEYVWPWKGGSLEGKPYSSNFIVYPLPDKEIEEKGYIQNPGY